MKLEEIKKYCADHHCEECLLSKPTGCYFSLKAPQFWNEKTIELISLFTTSDLEVLRKFKEYCDSIYCNCNQCLLIGDDGACLLARRPREWEC